MTPLSVLAVAGCLAVAPSADQIRLGDLAPAFGAISSSPELIVSLAPAPGAIRRFDLPELERLAARFHLSEPEREICFERRTAPLDPALILEAMQAQLPGARIELREFSRMPVPQGALEFAISGLRKDASGALWTGSLRYGGTHRLPVWARVDVKVQVSRAVAVEELPAGRPIAKSSVRVESVEAFPEAGPFVSDIETVAGKVPRRPIHSGAAIRASWLDAPKAVSRGETVEVEVREGGALLRFSGQALGAAAVGESVLVVNPMSNRRFAARVEAAGKVSVGKRTL